MAYKICPKCNNKNSPKSIYCNRCGEDIKDISIVSKSKSLFVVIVSLITIVLIFGAIFIISNNTDINANIGNNSNTGNKTPYDNIEIKDFDDYKTDLYDVEQDILNYILEKNDIDKDMVKNVEYLFYDKECKYRPTLKIELDDSFDSNSDLDKLTKVNGIYQFLCTTKSYRIEDKEKELSSYCSLKFRKVQTVLLVTSQHKYESGAGSFSSDIRAYYDGLIDDNYILDTYNKDHKEYKELLKEKGLDIQEIEKEMIDKGFCQVSTTKISNNSNSNSTTNSTNSSNNTNTTLDNPEDKISLSISPSKFLMHENYADATVFVHNNSNKDIAYIEVDIFIKDKNGKIVKSDWTNDSSTIKSGASQQIDTILKDVNDGYTVDVKLRKVRFK